MRFYVSGLLIAGTALPIMLSAAPAYAQTAERIDRRVEKLERDLQAVQRRVFPNGNVEPEIRPQLPGADPAGVPASSDVADLTARLDALERQVAQITGATEENGYKLRQLEQAMAEQKRVYDQRLQELGTARPEPAAQPAEDNVPAPVKASATPTGDAGEDAYLAGFQLWEQKQYPEAQAALEAMAKKYPKHRRASWARNLAGRAALDGGKPAAAAKILLGNYEADSKGERAQDSLYFLGAALVRLKQPANACKVYDELETVYGSGLRDWVKTRLLKARTDAKCG